MTGSHQFWAFFRFLIVGGSFSLIYSLVTAALIGFANTPPLPTIIIVYLFCIPAAFWAQRKIAFRSERSGTSAMLSYGATQLGTLSLVAVITSRFVTKNFYLDTALFLVTSGSAAVVSFLICRYIIFRPQAE